MKEKLMVVAAFTIGLGAGILASKRFFKRKYENIADEEISSVKTAYFNAVKKEEKKTKILDEIDEKREEYVRLVNDAYSTPLEKEYPRETDLPYEITEEEFSETELSYDKLTLNYFVDDGVFIDPYKQLDEENDVVDDPVRLIGEEGVYRLRTSDDTYVLYFRNDASGTDYEVKRISGSYHS